MGAILQLLGIFAVFRLFGPIFNVIGAIAEIIEAWPFILVAVIVIVLIYVFKGRKSK